MRPIYHHAPHPRFYLSPVGRVCWRFKALNFSRQIDDVSYNYCRWEMSFSALVYAHFGENRAKKPCKLFVTKWSPVTNCKLYGRRWENSIIYQFAIFVPILAVSRGGFQSYMQRFTFYLPSETSTPSLSLSRSNPRRSKFLPNTRKPRRRLCLVCTPQYIVFLNHSAAINSDTGKIWSTSYTWSGKTDSLSDQNCGIGCLLCTNFPKHKAALPTENL